MKNYTEDEFMHATKELLCIWIHLEAVDQGGELMPAWVMNFLKLSLYASDYLVPQPEAMAVMDGHADCTDVDALCKEVATTTCIYLGMGSLSSAMAPAIMPLLAQSRETRQRLFHESLTQPILSLQI